MEQVNNTPVYSEKDYEDISRQISKRWILITIPCVILLAVLICSLIWRIEWITSACTALIGVILIAAYDLAVKPLVCYRRHLKNVLHGRTRETTLPFVSLSEDVNLIDGVNCRALTCLDIDGKGRPYDRLFYFDALKQLPEFKEGDMLRIVHHDLMVADIQRA